jgi:hypothetical protein
MRFSFLFVAGTSMFKLINEIVLKHHARSKAGYIYYKYASEY